MRELSREGTAENQTDGSILIRAKGEDFSLKILVARCHIGPPAARVERVRERRIIDKENPFVY